MGKNVLLETMRDGKVALGLANAYPTAGIVEGMCLGWDWVWIDGQHGQHTYDSVHHAILASKSIGVDALIRVPSQDRSTLGLYADLAPSAIMIPMVNTAEEAEEVVQGLYFPPLGDRSYGGRRVIDLHTRNYYSELEMLVVAQIETIAAVENADQIIGTEGIDALFFGPDDMKIRMNLPIDATVSGNEQLREAMRRTAEAARRHGKYAGVVAANPSDLRMAIEMGFQLIAGGSDAAFVRAGAGARLGELRQAMETSLGSKATDSPSKGIY